MGIGLVELEALEAVEAERFIKRMTGSRREVGGSRAEAAGRGCFQMLPGASSWNPAK